LRRAVAEKFPVFHLREMSQARRAPMAGNIGRRFRLFNESMKTLLDPLFLWFLASLAFSAWIIVWAILASNREP
jgi:hypothetical protein